MAYLVCSLQRQHRFSQQTLSGLTVANTEHETVMQDFVRCDRSKLAVSGEFHESCVVLVVALSCLLAATVESVSLKRNILLRLTVLSELL